MWERITLLLVLTCAWTILCDSAALTQLRTLSKGGVACALIDGKGKDESRRAAEVVEDAREMVGSEGGVTVVRVQGQLAVSSLYQHEPSLRSPRAIHPHVLVYAGGRREALVELTPARLSASFLVEYFRTLLYNAVTHKALASPAEVELFLRDARALRIIRFAAVSGEEKREALADDCGFTSPPSLVDVSWWDQLCAHFLSNGSVRVASAPASLSPLPNTPGTADLLLAQRTLDDGLVRYDGFVVSVSVKSEIEREHACVLVKGMYLIYPLQSPLTLLSETSLSAPSSRGSILSRRRSTPTTSTHTARMPSTTPPPLRR